MLITILTKHLKMRLNYIIIIFLFFSTITNGQIYNRGKIILEKNAKINTNSNIYIYQTGKFDNSGNITTSGDWVNYGNLEVFSVNKGEVSLNGPIQKIKENPTEFGTLKFINNTKSYLETNISVKENMVFNHGIINLNGYHLRIKNTDPSSIVNTVGHIISENLNSRIIWDIEKISDNYSIPFSTKELEQIPIDFDVLEVGSGSIVLNTYSTDTNNVPLPENITSLSYGGEEISSIALDRFWYINTNGSKLKMKLSFSNNDIEGNQIDKNKLSLLFYDGTKWLADTTGKYIDNNIYSTVIEKSGWFTLFSNETVNTDQPQINSKIDKLLLFPNPTSKTISFKLPDNGSIYDIKIRDFLGKKVYVKSINNNSNKYNLDVSNLEKSIYFIVAKQNGKILHHGKFIKN